MCPCDILWIPPSRYCTKYLTFYITFYENVINMKYIAAYKIKLFWIKMIVPSIAEHVS